MKTALDQISTIGSQHKTIRKIWKILLAVLTTPPTILVYIFVLILIRLVSIVPYSVESLTKKNVVKEDLLQQNSKSCGSLLVDLCIAFYRHSLVHHYMHRNGSRCLFLPSCSDYAARAVRKYGLWKGLILIGNRFKRCTPLYKGDYLDFP